MSSHGSCNGCGKGFGIFTKESACHNCGLTFCNKCVDKKTAIPKHNNQVKHVCVRCYNILTGKIKDTTQKRDISPPANFLRNLQGAGSKQSNPVSRRSSGGHSMKQQVTQDPVVKRHLKPEYRNLSTEDMGIAERLEKLKQDRKEIELGPNPLPPIQDVEQRLARLKGTDGASESGPAATTSTVVMQPPPKSEFEQTSDLLNQVKDEVNIDRRVAGDGDVDTTPAASHTTETPAGGAGAEGVDDIQALIAQAASELEIDAHKAVQDLHKDKEIMARLEELKKRKRKSSTMTDDDKTVSSNTGEQTETSDSDNEEDQVKHIVQQALEERRLDDRLEAEGGFKPALRKEKSVDVPLSPESMETDPDELPWCCICNEDAKIRCLDCDNDLYCRRCYK